MVFFLIQDDDEADFYGLGFVEEVAEAKDSSHLRLLLPIPRDISYK